MLSYAFEASGAFLTIAKVFQGYSRYDTLMTWEAPALEQPIEVIMSRIQQHKRFIRKATQYAVKGHDKELRAVWRDVVKDPIPEQESLRVELELLRNELLLKKKSCWKVILAMLKDSCLQAGL